MIDLGRIASFDWEDGNSSKSADKHGVRAFSSEVETGSRQENASNQKPGAPFRFHRNGRGSSQAEAENVFFNDPLIVVEDARHSETERRLNALGKTSQNRLLHVTFTLRENGTMIRVISARDMHRKERQLYEQA